MRYRVYYGVYLMISLLLFLFLRDKFSAALALTLLLLPLFSFLSLFFAKRKLSFRQSVSESAAVKGQTVRYTLQLKNGGRFFCPHIIIKYHAASSFAYSNPPIPSLFLSPRETKKSHLPTLCKLRGRCEIGVKKIELWDFLRLFKLTVNPAEPLTLLIHPRLHPIRPLQAAQTSALTETRFFQRGEDDYTVISDFREYTEQDSIKKVHWKLSAKKEDLIVKNFASYASAGTAVALDLRPVSGGAGYAEEVQDSMAGLAVSIIRHIVEKSESVNFLYNTDCNETLHVANMLDFGRLYSLSALLNFTSDLPFEGLLESCLQAGTGPVPISLGSTPPNAKALR